MFSKQTALWGSADRRAEETFELNEVEGVSKRLSGRVPRGVEVREESPEDVLPEGVLLEGALPEGVLPEGVLPEL